MGEAEFSDERARAFGPRGGLDAVFDRATNQYLMPEIPVADRPACGRPPTESGPVAAIVDTGLLSAHPLIAPRLVAAEDFTGEGPQDRDGHGTQVAIMLIVGAPNTRLLSAKVLADDDAAPVVQAERIGSGIRWAVDRGARLINLCVGFVQPCSAAHESLTSAVRDALESNCIIVVAGEATCPAGCDDRLIVVGEQRSDGRWVTNVSPTVFAPTPGMVRVSPWEEWLAQP